MSSFQIEAMRALWDITSGFQLQGYPIAESGNGIEYKNHLNSTVMTVYHDRLDPENLGAIEVAVGCQNIAEELSIPINSVEHWMDNLQQRYPTAKAKSPLWWPRITLKSLAQLAQLHEDLQLLYSGESLASATPETEETLQASPHDVDERVLREVQTRRGQPAFRAALIRAYGVCAISGCADMEALEAAHITPHSSDENYSTRNGLLLRADIHTLFDLRLISVNPRSGKIVVVASLGTTYRQYEGQLLRLPSDPKDHPDPRGLMDHFKAYGGRV
jgi:hypothetical protein